ncbi:MAG: peptidoglycan DD-metalloendopeptidase family protein [Betaproteobacteria bacterium]|nr:peptidoglycan DD-metalloendopeptidase family protein [Betaproteobacteria bacterium]
MRFRIAHGVSPSVNSVFSVARLFLVCAALAVFMAGCTARRGAPVVERAPEARPAPARPAVSARPAPKPADARPEFYAVRKGDTLYSIALDHGLDYRELAQLNGITDPGVIRVGQQLRLRPAAAAATAAPFKTAPGVQGRPLGETAAAGGAIKTQPKAVRAPYNDQSYAQLSGARPELALRAEPRAPGAPSEGDDGIHWGWPATGRVVSSFNDGSNLKGISIAGKLGQPVLASAPGRVIFSGTGIRGFGKLIVIKHNNTFLSVYAHNSELLVKEGQTVAKGQKIAEMGSTDTNQVKLHFEIRRLGKPVDPVKLLPPA